MCKTLFTYTKQVTLTSYNFSSGTQEAKNISTQNFSHENWLA